jgi:hypothetical protein
MWQCPACEEEVQRGPGEILPARHVVYRCLHCLIDLVFDEDYARFKPAPFPAEPTSPKRRRRKKQRVE